MKKKSIKINFEKKKNRNSLFLLTAKQLVGMNELNKFETQRTQLNKSKIKSLK